jgi:hypothetical protein
MNTAEEKGFDAEKKVLAIKCQIALNLQEFPFAIGITMGNVTERVGILTALFKEKHQGTSKK